MKEHPDPVVHETVVYMRGWVDGYLDAGGRSNYRRDLDSRAKQATFKFVADRSAELAAEEGSE